jgi:hypothetical protein
LVDCLQPLNSVGLLGLAQEFGLTWRVGEEEEDDNGKDDGRRALLIALEFVWEAHCWDDLPMMNRYRHDSILECLIRVIPYAKALATQLATGTIPSRNETRNPSSCRW